MTLPKVRPPREFKPKPGGLVDAVRHGKFVEWLCDEWPYEKKDWDYERDKMIENEIDDMREEKARQDEDNANWYYDQEVNHLSEKNEQRD